MRSLIALFCMLSMYIVGVMVGYDAGYKHAKEESEQGMTCEYPRTK